MWRITFLLFFFLDLSVSVNSICNALFPDMPNSSAKKAEDDQLTVELIERPWGVEVRWEFDYTEDYFDIRLSLQCGNEQPVMRQGETTTGSIAFHSLLHVNCTVLTCFDYVGGLYYVETVPWHVIPGISSSDIMKVLSPSLVPVSSVPMTNDISSTLYDTTHFITISISSLLQSPVAISSTVPVQQSIAFSLALKLTEFTLILSPNYDSVSLVPTVSPASSTISQADFKSTLSSDNKSNSLFQHDIATTAVISTSTNNIPTGTPTGTATVAISRTGSNIIETTFAVISSTIATSILIACVLMVWSFVRRYSARKRLSMNIDEEYRTAGRHIQLLAVSQSPSLITLIASLESSFIVSGSTSPLVPALPDKLQEETDSPSPSSSSSESLSESCPDITMAIMKRVSKPPEVEVMTRRKLILQDSSSSQDSSSYTSAAYYRYCFTDEVHISIKDGSSLIATSRQPIIHLHPHTDSFN